MNHKSTRSKAQRRDAGINCELLEAELFRLRQHAAGRSHAADLCGGRARLHTYASVQRRNRCQRREGEPELHRGGNKRARRQRGCRKLSKAKRCPKNNNGFLWVTSEVIYSSQCAAGSNISGAWRKASSRCQEKAERHQTIFPQSCSHELALLLCASACCCSEGATRSRCIRGQGLLT